MSLADDLSWWEQFRSSDAYRRLQTRPIAYFCAEFALLSNLKTYSGGLGVLAGDILREASDQKLPLIGVGLLYGEAMEQLQKTRNTRMAGESDESEIQKTGDSGSPNLRLSDFSGSLSFPSVPKINIGLELAVARGQPLAVRVPIQDRYVTVVAYRWPATKLGSGWWSGGVPTAPGYLLTTATVVLPINFTRLIKKSGSSKK